MPHQPQRPTYTALPLPALGDFPRRIPIDLLYFISFTGSRRSYMKPRGHQLCVLTEQLAPGTFTIVTTSTGGKLNGAL
jgi:hypothetical protein